MSSPELFPKPSFLVRWHAGLELFLPLETETQDHRQVSRPSPLAHVQVGDLTSPLILDIRPQAQPTGTPCYSGAIPSPLPTCPWDQNTCTISHPALTTPSMSLQTPDSWKRAKLKLLVAPAPQRQKEATGLRMFFLSLPSPLPNYQCSSYLPWCLLCTPQ